MALIRNDRGAAGVPTQPDNTTGLALTVSCRTHSKRGVKVLAGFPARTPGRDSHLKSSYLYS